MAHCKGRTHVDEACDLVRYFVEMCRCEEAEWYRFSTKYSIPRRLRVESVQERCANLAEAISHTRVVDLAGSLAHDRHSGIWSTYAVEDLYVLAQDEEPRCNVNLLAS
jgi:hypothetical protein